jgi:hypothetical protein
MLCSPGSYGIAGKAEQTSLGCRLAAMLQQPCAPKKDRNSVDIAHRFADREKRNTVTFQFDGAIRRLYVNGAYKSQKPLAYPSEWNGASGYEYLGACLNWCCRHIHMLALQPWDLLWLKWCVLSSDLLRLDG